MRLKPATGLMRSPLGLSGLNVKMGPVCTMLAMIAMAAPTMSTGAISVTKLRTSPAIQPPLSSEMSSSAELANRLRDIWLSSCQAEPPQIIARMIIPHIMSSVLKSRLLATWPCLRASSSLNGVACSLRFCSCSSTDDGLPETPGGCEQRREHAAGELDRHRQAHESQHDLHREAQHEHVELRHAAREHRERDVREHQHQHDRRG